MNTHRVVITGIGITSNLGHTFAEVTNSLRNGKSNIAVQEDRKQMGFRSPLSGQLPPFTKKYEISRNNRRFMSEAAFYAAITWLKAVDECGLDPSQFIGSKVGVVTGNDSASDPVEKIFAILDEYKETHFLGSEMSIKTLNSSCSLNLGALLGAQGINLTISSACASGAHAVGYGYSLIRSGVQDAIIAGGFQELNRLSMSSFDALGAFSTNPDPAKASRPFDHRRDGLVPGGGGAIIVLESLARAEKLGRKIYGEIASYSFSSDGSHLTIPSGEGARRCIRQALKNAQMSATDIDYINAHATSTPVGDRVEATVINEIFGENGPLVSSTKSLTGHECWMSGASEVVYCLAMMHGNFIAGNVNFGQQEEEAPKINIAAKTVACSPRTILSNSFGFGGTNACLIVKEFTE